MRTVNASGSRSSRARAARASPARISARTGLPVTCVRPTGKQRVVSAKDTATALAIRPSARFAKPGTAFCSWITRGMRARPAASTVGTEAYPPTPNTTCGRNSRRKRPACRIVPGRAQRGGESAPPPRPAHRGGREAPEGAPPTRQDGRLHAARGPDEEGVRLRPPRPQGIVHRQGREEMAARPAPRDHDAHRHASAHATEACSEGLKMNNRQPARECH